MLNGRTYNIPNSDPTYNIRESQVMVNHATERITESLEERESI